MRRQALTQWHEVREVLQLDGLKTVMQLQFPNAHVAFLCAYAEETNDSPASTSSLPTLPEIDKKKQYFQENQ